jgi:hypothetical protein
MSTLLGLMVRTYLTDSLSKAREIVCGGWRRVLCGEIIDRQILRNRARQSMVVAIDCWRMDDPSDDTEPAELPAYPGDAPS